MQPCFPFRPSFSATQSSAYLNPEESIVKLDSQKVGPNVVLLKNGNWGIGVANKNVKTNLTPINENAWVLRSDGNFMANGELIGKLEQSIEDGDSIGIAFDHIELKFFINNVQIPTTMLNIRGPVYPLLYVDDNAILDVLFHDFTIPVPVGYEEIMIEQTLL